MSEETSNQPITLGELTTLLEARPQDQTVVFDFAGMRPGGIDSYRGYYDHLAFEPETDGAISVLALIEMLREADGKVYTGYKGGDFRMDRDTPLWVSTYGESWSTAVVGLVDECKYMTVIRTAWCEDWDRGMERARRVLFDGLGYGNVR